MERERSGSGRVVVVNGGSSSGKTALARRLQTTIDGTWVVLGVDLFLWMLPSRLFDDPAGLRLEDGVISRGDEYMRVYAAFQRSVAALADNGVEVLVDDVLLDGGADQQQWSAALHGFDVCWVGVRCDPDIAERREIARGDRVVGTARAQASAVHERVQYDIEVDTGELDVEHAADVVLGRLRERWPDLGRSTSAGPDEYPLSSAWTDRGSIRPAPWERQQGTR